MSFGASGPVLEGSLEVEHVTETMLRTREAAAAGSFPTEKPATPQMSFVSAPLDAYSLSGIVRVRAWVDPWPANITFYCELVLDGVSQGVKTRTNPGAADFTYHFGDYAPLVSHNIQVYLWASASGYSMKGAGLTDTRFNTGTVSSTPKIVWKKTEKKVSAILFSTSSTVDMTNLYLNTAQVSDLSLWWSGVDITLKGADFFEYGGSELIYQLITVT